MLNSTIKYLIFFILLSVSIGLIAQEKSDSIKTKNKPKTGKLDNFVFGGIIGLQFGTVTLIDVSPNVGYYITPKILTGVGFTYEYYSQKWYEKRISSSIYGGRIFNEYIFFENIGTKTRMRSNFAIFSHVEYEALNVDRDFSDMQSSAKTGRFWLHGILVGGGFKQMMGKRASLNISILYNIINDKRSPFDNPVFRIGFYL
jgi:hypothetical protein